MRSKNYKRGVTVNTGIGKKQTKLCFTIVLFLFKIIAHGNGMGKTNVGWGSDGWLRAACCGSRVSYQRGEGFKKPGFEGIIANKMSEISLG